MKNFKCKWVKGGIIPVAAVTCWLYTLEGKSNEVYVDQAGVLTVCGGHTSPDLKMGQFFSDDECNVLMSKDGQKFFDAINNYVRREISQNTALALLSFSYNIGVNAFKNSTSLRLINADKIKEGCEAMRLFNKITVTVKDKNGIEKRVKVINKGLNNRRDREIKKCLSY